MMQRDRLREARKERQFWDGLRAKDERRIRDRYRVETELALQRSLAMATSRQALRQGTSGKTAAAPRSGVARFDVSESSGQDRRESEADEPEDLMTRATKTATTVKKEAEKFVEKLDRAVDALVPQPTGPMQAEARRTSGAVFFLLLLALFLVPSFAVALLLLGVIHLRNGHRLQAGIFGLAGSAVLFVVLASVQEMRGERVVAGEADAARWRAECTDSAVRLTGFVYESAPGGVIINDVAGAPVDEYGCALVVTDRKAARSGEKWDLRVYPVGTREAPNAIGLVRAMPAYADSLEEAVSWRADAERTSSTWWWVRMLRSMREV